MADFIRDLMVTNDDLLITNKLSKEQTPCAPHGRLFEILGMQGNRRVVKEIACNIVVVGGAITALENIAGITASWRPSTKNDIHSVSATGVGESKLKLFGVGTGGAGLEFGSVVAPTIKQRDVLNPVPMRYGSSITGGEATKYFMKAGSAAPYSWYLKEFNTTPIIKSCWKNAVDAEADGTEIVTDIYNNLSNEGIETFCEIEIALSTLDVRQYFETIGSLAQAKYNTIGFYTGAKNAGGTEYGSVRLYSVITFNNRDLTVATASKFLYRIYSLT
jgi:hypothetical protein